MLSSPDLTSHPTVLQICLDRTSTPSGGTCSFKIQTAERTITSGTVACSALGLSTTQNEKKAIHKNAYDYKIPTSCLLQLEADIAGSLRKDVPLWLQFSSDCGNLPLLPWERLLHPIVQAPVLHLPYYDFKPFAATSSCLDIVLCASRYGSNQSSPIEVLLDKLARSLLETLQRLPGERDVVVIHIFSDRLTYQHLQRLLADRLALTDGSGVRLYDPAAADIQVHKPVSPLAPPLEGCTWLRWILNAFQGRSADVIHFLCRGSLSINQGCLLLKGTPGSAHDTRTWSIGSQELNTFSTQLGAWCNGFSTPDIGSSAAGLRLLIDQLARLRPGAFLLKAGKIDRGEQTLANLYRFLCNEVPGVLPSSPELSIYCHPSRILKSTQQAQTLQQYTLAKGTPLRIMQSAENTPGWIASTQRYLEQSTAQLLHTPDTPNVKKSTQQGIEQALSFLSNVLVQNATAQGSDKIESKEDLL